MIEDQKWINKFDFGLHKISKCLALIFENVYYNQDTSRGVAAYQSYRKKVDALLDSIASVRGTEEVETQIRLFESLCNNFEIALESKDKNAIDKKGHKLITQSALVKLYFEKLLGVKSTVKKRSLVEDIKMGL
jgi:hypothetical protein